MIINDMRDVLSICIPTYNRADILRENLFNLIDKVSKYGITINVSDNASEDNTKDIVNQAQSIYPYIIYSRNDINIGFDRNCAKVLKMNHAKYAWLMSDNDSVTDDVAELIELLGAGDYNLVLLGYNRNIETKIYTKRDDVTAELAGIMSWISTLIINKELIEIANFSRYYDSAFVHTGSLLEALTNIENVTVLHLSNVAQKYIYEIKEGCSYSERAFAIFSGIWINLILSLPPQYGFHVKQKAIFSLNAAPFKITSLMGYRAVGMYNYTMFLEQKNVLKAVVPFKYYIAMLLVALCPAAILRSIRDIKKKIIGN